MTTTASTPPLKRVAGCRFCDIVEAKLPPPLSTVTTAAGLHGLQADETGEMVVIPNQHYSDFLALRISGFRPASTRLAPGAPILSPPRVGFVVNGFGISHAHIIVVPQHSITTSLGSVAAVVAVVQLQLRSLARCCP